MTEIELDTIYSVEYIPQIIIDTIVDVQLDTIYNTEYITQIVVDTLIEEAIQLVVTEYKKIECVYQSRVICEIEAKVNPWAIRKKVYASSTNASLNGNNLYAQYRSKQYILVSLFQKTPHNYLFDSIILLLFLGHIYR